MRTLPDVPVGGPCNRFFDRVGVKDGHFNDRVAVRMGYAVRKAREARPLARRSEN